LKDKEIKISCSARKDWHYHISDWIDFEKTHAKIHSGFEFDYDDIDYALVQQKILSHYGAEECLML